MIFQEFNLIPNFSAKMNVMTGRLGYLSTRKSISMIANKEINEKADNNLDKVGLLDKKNKSQNIVGRQNRELQLLEHSCKSQKSSWQMNL